jgi:hypothetical protein
MKPYWQIGLLSAEEANRLCDKEEQNIAFADKNHPSTDELDFLNSILSNVKLEASLKSFDWRADYYSDSHPKSLQKMLPRICCLLGELGYGASTAFFKDSNGVEYCHLLVTWV